MTRSPSTVFWGAALLYVARFDNGACREFGAIWFHEREEVETLRSRAIEQGIGTPAQLRKECLYPRWFDLLYFERSGDDVVEPGAGQSYGAWVG